MTNKYHVEDEMEAGSHAKVYKNKLGIREPAQMYSIEEELLSDLYGALLTSDAILKPLTCNDIFHWHSMWLGNVYTWAGEERSVNMSKDGFLFCAASQIPRSLELFQKNYLNRYTPNAGTTRKAVVMALARTHAEFIIIHPFREGNGRIGRLLSDVMAVQNDYPPLDYTDLTAANRERYFESIRASYKGDYDLIIELFNTLLPKSHVDSM